MTEKTELFLLIILLVVITIITHFLSVMYFTRKKKENIFSVIGKVSTCLMCIALILTMASSCLITNNSITLAFFVYSIINLIISLLIMDFKQKDIHDISCYDFPFDSFEEFKKHMKKELISLEFEEDKLDEDLIIYKREIPFLEARAIYHVKELNKEVYRKVISKKISKYFNESRWLLLKHGINLSIIIYADKIENYKEIVTRVSILFRKGPNYLTLPVAIDAQKKKLYICDNDKWDVPGQKRLAYKTLNHIYKTFIKE